MATLRGSCAECKRDDIEEFEFVRSHLQSFIEGHTSRRGRELFTDARNEMATQKQVLVAGVGLRCRNCVVLERDKYEALRGRRWFAEQQTSAVVFERRPFGMSRIAGETAYIVGQVESNMPAAMGGVQLGWRVNAVNGEDVRGEQEAVVKALLKQVALPVTVNFDIPIGVWTSCASCAYPLAPGCTCSRPECMERDFDDDRNREQGGIESKDEAEGGAEFVDSWEDL